MTHGNIAERIYSPACVSRRMRLSSRRTNPSVRWCVRDTLVRLARGEDARLHSLPVLRVFCRDAFEAGLSGGLRCARNSRSVVCSLRTCHWYVRVFNSSGYHILADASGAYLGSVRWEDSHCPYLPHHYPGVPSNTVAPWLQRNAGGRNATVQVEDIIARRISMPACDGRCEARTFRLLQCTRRGKALRADTRLCSQHMKEWHEHGLVGQDMTASHAAQLKKCVRNMFANPSLK